MFDRSLLLRVCALAAMAQLAACSSSSPSTTAKGAVAGDTTQTADSKGQDAASGTDTAAGDTAAGDTAAGDTTPAADIVIPAGNTLIKDGEYYMGVQAAPFGNLKPFFKVTLTAGGALDGGGVLKTFEIRAVSADGWIGDPLATAKDVAVGKDNTFKISFDSIVLPAKTTPTGSDVPVSLVLTGVIHKDNWFCGDVDGMVPDFGQALTGSKFRGVAWGTEKTPAESSCEGDNNPIYTHIATCPSIAVGTNKMNSATRDRTFEVRLPDGPTPTEALPLVLLYHGVGGDAPTMITDAHYDALMKTEKLILVAPNSERDPKTGKAVLKTDWYYGASLFDMDNPDLVYFDDLVNCVSKTYQIDPKRIYVTGMSGGGLESTFIGANRAAVVAAASPFSGGFLVKWPKYDHKVPFLVTWGGTEDSAYSQNFDTLAKQLIGYLLGAGNVTVQCNHGTGHKWPAEMTAASWKFLSSFTLDSTDNPFATSLPAVFPSYCSISK